MGLLFAQLLPRYTTATRAGAGRKAHRIELARRFGLDPAYNVSDRPLSQVLPPSEKYDCVIECTGRLEGWQEAFDCTTPGGQVLLFGGVPRDAVFSVDSYRLHYEEVRVLGSFHFSPRDVAKAREHLLAGGLELDALISGCLPLSRLPEAMASLQAGDALQYAIDPWG